MLKPGVPAPEFEARTWRGDTVRLSDFAGKKIWLAFFRYASCPLCNLRVHDMKKRAGAYRAAGLEVLAVFQSPPQRIAAYVGKQDPPFPLIGDPDEALYKKYGLKKSLAAMASPSVAVKLAKAAAKGYLPGAVDGTLTRIPGDFLIDGESVLREVYLGKDIGDHIPFDAVDRFAGLKTAGT